MVNRILSNRSGSLTLRPVALIHESDQYLNAFSYAFSYRLKHQTFISDNDATVMISLKFSFNNIAKTSVQPSHLHSTYNSQSQLFIYPNMILWKDFRKA